MPTIQQMVHYVRYGVFMSVQTKGVLDSIVVSILPRTRIAAAHGQQFVVVCGVTHSGKSWLIGHDPKLSTMWRIDSRAIHASINQLLLCMREGNAANDVAYLTRQRFSRYVHEAAIVRGLKLGLSIVCDDANLRLRDRVQLINAARASGRGCETILVHVTCEDSVLSDRLQRADAQLINRGEAPVWQARYQKQLTQYEPIRNYEVGVVFKYKSGSMIGSGLQLII